MGIRQEERPSHMTSPSDYEMRFRMPGSSSLRAARARNRSSRAIQQRPAHTTCHCSLGLERMFPERDHCPTLRLQLSSDSPVSHAIRRFFWAPVSGVISGLLIASWAPVPKASIHKDSETRAREGEVGPSRQRHMAAPSRNSALAEYFNQAQLGSLVTRATNFGHVS